MSRMHGRNCHVTVQLPGPTGRVIEFDAHDWSLDMQMNHIDVSQMGANLAWIPGPSTGEFRFSGFSQAEPDHQTTTAEIVLDRYLKMIGVRQE
jgi:hypothetical protein